MAKGNRTRALPSTPRARTSDAQAETPAGPTDRTVVARRASPQPRYLTAGTGCTGGHSGGPYSRVGDRSLPSAKLTRIGFGLILWCSLGMMMLADVRIGMLVLEVAVLWLSYTAFVQRRAGHRGRCWRTRTWRQAWGGLVPVFHRSQQAG